MRISGGGGPWTDKQTDNQTNIAETYHKPLRAFLFCSERDHFSIVMTKLETTKIACLCRCVQNFIPISGKDAKVKGLAAPSNLSMNQTLEGHSGVTISVLDGELHDINPLHIW